MVTVLTDFSLKKKISWVVDPAGHGKGICDSHGSVIKRGLWNYLQVALWRTAVAFCNKCRFFWVALLLFAMQPKCIISYPFNLCCIAKCRQCNTNATKMQPKKGL